MIEDDDDIPVLTQILRTGDPRVMQDAPSSAPTTSTAVDRHASEPTPDADALVIGNEPQVVITDGFTAPFDDDDEGHDAGRYAVSDEHLERAGDSFVLPQDHDQAAAEARGARFDEPDIGNGVDRPTVVAVAGPVVSAAPRERRINPFMSDEPRDRRHGADDGSLQRLASITSTVRESVLVALQTRIDTELDARIAQAMHREVETAIAQLQDKLREGLTEALRDVVARAVDDEMTRFVADERDVAARLDPRKSPGRFDA